MTESINKQIDEFKSKAQDRQNKLRKQGINCMCLGSGVWRGFDCGVEGSHPCDCKGAEV